MPRASEHSSNSDSDSDELQRIKEAVFDVYQPTLPSNGVAVTSSKPQAEGAKLRAAPTKKSARCDSEDERDDIGREPFSRDVQQFIAKKLAKFLDDSIESSTSSLEFPKVAKKDVHGEVAKVSASVKVFSWSVPAATSPDASDEDVRSINRGKERRAHRLRKDANGKRSNVGRSITTKEDKKRHISSGDEASSSRSSGSEEEEARQLELSSVAVSANDVLREREVLDKYGVKRLGKLEVYSLQPAPAASHAVPSSCVRVNVKDRGRQATRERGKANSEKSPTVTAGKVTTAAAPVRSGSAVGCGVSQQAEQLAGMDEAASSRPKGKKRKHKKTQ